jgi:hypothetical protein
MIPVSRNGRSLLAVALADSVQMLVELPPIPASLLNRNP